MPSDLRVLIAGSGLAGLMLGIMLEKAGIEYLILERSPNHRPLGSAISLNGTVLRLFEQLGMIDEVNAISKSSGRLHVVNEHASTQGYIDFEHFYERYGYYSKVFARPDLHMLLVSKIPPERLIMGKRILSTQQNEVGVMVRCQDGTSYHADILVGADGAYSSVRAAIFKELKEKNALPRSDSERMRFDQHCVVGVTEPLDPEEYPVLRQQFCEIHAILGKKSPYSIYLVPVPGNRFAWSIGGRIPETDMEKQGQSHSYAEWKPENAEEILHQVRDFQLPELSLGRNPAHMYSATSLPDPHSAFSQAQQPRHNDNESIYTQSTGSELVSDPMSDPSSTTTHPHLQNLRRHPHGASSTSLPHDQRSFVDPEMLNDPDIPHKSKYHPPARPGTVGALIDATPVELISKVMLEEKFFKSWFCGRSVLIGDACHKLLPFAGQGAIQAFLDGISLANKLYDLKSTSMESITAAFKAYTNERQPIAKSSVGGSRTLGRLLHKQGILSDFIRKVTFNHVPTWMLYFTSDKMHTHRPQLNYLPIVPDRGSAKAQVQKYSPRYLAERAQGIQPRDLRTYTSVEHQQFQKQHQEWQQQQQTKRRSLLVGEQRKRRSLADDQRSRKSHDEKRPELDAATTTTVRPRLMRHVTEPESANVAQFYQDLMHVPADSLPRPLGSSAKNRAPPTTVVSQQIMPTCPPRSASLPPKVSTAPLHIVPRSSRSNTLSSRCSREQIEEQQQTGRIRWSQELEECLEELPVVESDEDGDNEGDNDTNDNSNYTDIDDDYNSLYVEGFDMPADQISATLSQSDQTLVTKDNTVFAFPAPPPSVCTSPLPSVATTPLPSLSTTPLPSIPSDDEDTLESGTEDSFIMLQGNKYQQHSAAINHHGMVTPPSTEEIMTSARLHNLHYNYHHQGHHGNPQHQHQYQHSARTRHATDSNPLPEMTVAEHQHLLQLSQHINQLQQHQHQDHGYGHGGHRENAHHGHFGQHHHAQHHPHYAHHGHGNAAGRLLPPGGIRPQRDPHHRPATPLQQSNGGAHSSSRLNADGRVVIKSHSSSNLRPIDEVRPLHQNSPSNAVRSPPPRINTSREMSPASFSCPASPTTTGASHGPADLETSLSSLRMNDSPIDSKMYQFPAVSNTHTAASSIAATTSPSSSSLHLTAVTAPAV